MPTPSCVCGGSISLVLAAATGPHIRVKLNSSGQAAIAGLADRGIGVTENGGASGDRVSVRLFTDPGSFHGVSSEAITAGADVYSVASGKVSVTSTSAVKIGQARTAASAADEWFEFIPISQT